MWDCKPDDPSQPTNWVELKTSKEIITDQDRENYEHKLLKFWIQSFLLGVPKIIVGFRNKNGILKQLEELETAKIPTTVKNGKQLANACICFTEEFLDSKRHPLQST